eukprot:TRINITY_DN49261_c0_g1_i1.p1 TRINITY_DN49261_c0_g1~~TRINITY_DN49261_c0_g1_i1.p1  ORF type:complete len:270 (-),score=51.50 TRINITY_DN49261_c0_g1_i1:118-927(-)
MESPRHELGGIELGGGEPDLDWSEQWRTFQEENRILAGHEEEPRMPKLPFASHLVTNPAFLAASEQVSSHLRPEGEDQMTSKGNSFDLETLRSPTNWSYGDAHTLSAAQGTIPFHIENFSIGILKTRGKASDQLDAHPGKLFEQITFDLEDTVSRVLAAGSRQQEDQRGNARASSPGAHSPRSVASNQSRDEVGCEVPKMDSPRRDLCSGCNFASSSIGTLGAATTVLHSPTAEQRLEDESVLLTERGDDKLLQYLASSMEGEAPLIKL